jgi:hypothetical protein
MLENLKQNSIEMAELPQDSRNKFYQFYDVVHMMIVDNKIHPNEIKISKHLAVRFGYPADRVAEIVEQVKMNIRNGIGYEESMRKVNNAIHGR